MHLLVLIQKQRGRFYDGVVLGRHVALLLHVQVVLEHAVVVQNVGGCSCAVAAVVVVVVVEFVAGTINIVGGRGAAE